MPISFFGGARKNDFVKNLFCKSLQNFKVDFFSIASAKINRSMVLVGLGRDTTKIQNTPPFWHDQPRQRNALRQPTTLQLNAQANAIATTKENSICVSSIDILIILLLTRGWILFRSYCWSRARVVGQGMQFRALLWKDLNLKLCHEWNLKSYMYT